MHMVTNYDFETPDDPPGMSQDGENHVGKTHSTKNYKTRVNKKNPNSFNVNVEFRKIAGVMIQQKLLRWP